MLGLPSGSSELSLLGKLQKVRNECVKWLEIVLSPPTGKQSSERESSALNRGCKMSSQDCV